MTIKTDERHPLDVLYRTCKRYPGGIEALAARLDMKVDTLYKKLRSQVETHHIGFDGELSEILFCLAEAKVEGWADVLRVFCWRHAHIAIPMPDLSGCDDGQLFEMVLKVVKENGDVANALAQATSGSNERERQISSDELAMIDLQVSEAVAALASLLDRARASHEAAKAKGLVR